MSARAEIDLVGVAIESLERSAKLELTIDSHAIGRKGGEQLEHAADARERELLCRARPLIRRHRLLRSQSCLLALSPVEPRLGRICDSGLSLLQRLTLALCMQCGQFFHRLRGHGSPRRRLGLQSRVREARRCDDRAEELGNARV